MSADARCSVDQFGRSLKGLENSFCPFVVAPGMRDKDDFLGFGVLKIASEFLCRPFLNVPMLMATRICESARERDALESLARRL